MCGGVQLCWSLLGKGMIVPGLPEKILCSKGPLQIYVKVQVQWTHSMGSGLGRWLDFSSCHQTRVLPALVPPSRSLSPVIAVFALLWSSSSARLCVLPKCLL